jgi:hypothetical protein
MTVIAVSTLGAILIAIGCIALLALAGGALTRNVFGKTAEQIDPIGDRIEPPESPEFKRPRDEGDLL